MLRKYTQGWDGGDFDGQATLMAHGSLKGAVSLMRTCLHSGRVKTLTGMEICEADLVQAPPVPVGCHP
ncbi:hypothetical protein, partial [Brevundimonas sp. TWP2-3-4b2]|uniref:hypothetical protein n=1 Tax=Brevundimonas sp. TWP2-3-4b2 TaxID=2804595 RepID=UPI003CF5DA8B